MTEAVVTWKPLWSFACCRCAAGGVTPSGAERVCDSCGADMHVWPCGERSPLRNWHWPQLQKIFVRMMERAGSKKKRSRKKLQDGEH